MKGTMFILKASGEMVASALERKPELEDMQKAVGGYLELVPYFDKFAKKDCVVFCNEEGKVDGLEYNAVATRHWQACCDYTLTDYLVGDVCIIVGDKELMESL